MRLFKSKAFRHAEHALNATRTMDEVDVVRNAARRQQLTDETLKREEVTRYQCP